ncbi:MAG: lactate racemase domain-containing protein, partial [Anaerolineae bacterium]
MLPVAVAFPRVALIEQRIEAPRLDDVAAAVRSEIARLGVAARVRPGMSVAVTAGSRGIANISLVLATIVAELKRMAARPFLVPCMGSHGGATAAGQVEVLSSLGITEATVGCPIRSSMEAVPIGVTPEGIPVFQDRLAFESDGIVVVNRIKAHTDFTGPVESGLMKMLTIGLGKHQGALAAHRHAIRHTYRAVIVSMAREIIRRSPILFGLGLVENARDETAIVRAMWPAEFEETEQELLRRAKEMMARLPFRQLDALLIDRMGKEISGSGMDTNVLGRRIVFGEEEPASPRITRIAVCDLTEASHGNAIGVGLADFTTQRLVDKIDRRQTYINGLTSGSPERARLPMVAANDREAAEWTLLTCGAVDTARARLVRIQDTLHLERFYASEALLPEIEADPRLKIVGEWAP